jgi:hypothetical protein
MKKLLKGYLKDPLATIAINTTLFIMGCLFFGLLATIGIISEWVRDYKTPPTDIRLQHLKQHNDEQLKYDEMIILLDSINKKIN